MDSQSDKASIQFIQWFRSLSPGKTIEVFSLSDIFYTIP